MQSILEVGRYFVDQYGEFIALLSIPWAFVLSVIKVWNFFYDLGRRDLEQELMGMAASQNERARVEMITRYNQPASKWYYRQIRDFLSWAKGFWGRKFFGELAFNKCVGIALIYPIVGFLIIWLIFGHGIIGGVEILPDQVSFSERLTIFGLIAFWVILAYYIFSVKLHSQLLEFSIYYLNAAGSFFHNNPKNLPRPILAILQPMVLVAAVLAVFTLILAPSSFLIILAMILPIPTELTAPIIIFIFIIFGGVTLAYTTLAYSFKVEINKTRLIVIILLSLIGALVGAVSLTNWLLGSETAATATILFFIVVPLFNGAADYLSWGMTRCFLFYMVWRKPGAFKVVTHLALDLLFGFVSLAILLGGTILFLEIWNLITPQSLAFDWRTYWSEVTIDYSKGTLVMLMLLTTLAPTALHSVAGLTGVFLGHSRHHAKIVEILRDPALAFVPTQHTIIKGLVRKARTQSILKAFLVFAFVIALVVWLFTS